MAKQLPRQFNCAVEFALGVLGGKWKTVILCYLKFQPLRYADMRTLLPKLSDKMLSERLKDLQRAGLIERKKSSNGGGIVYLLTERGRSLEPILGDLDEWGRRNAPIFEVRIGQPLSRLREAQAQSDAAE
jgi:DNA-binding HxlR family transcriptional regulator